MLSKIRSVLRDQLRAPIILGILKYPIGIQFLQGLLDVGNTVGKPAFSGFPAILVLCLVALVQGAPLYAQNPDDSSRSFLNAYDQGNMEQLVSQGLLAMEAGDFPEAERIFLEATQVAKVNYGLSSKEQRIPLRHAIEAQLAQGKFEQVENHLSYFEWLNDEIYTRDFYAYLEGTELLSELLLKASADANNPLGVRYLIAAKNLNWRAVSGIEATLGDNHIQLAPWLYNIVLAHYYQSSLVKNSSVISYVHRSDDDEEINGFTLTMGESLRISYRIGRELLGRIAAIYSGTEGLPAESLALVQIYQADWEMLFGNETSALELYTDAYKQLLANGFSSDQANRVFARPTVLPARTLATRLDAFADEDQGPVRFHAWTPNYPATHLPSEDVAINSSAGAEFMALVKFTLHPLLPTGLMSNDRIIPLGFNVDDLEVISANPDNDLVRQRALYEVSLLQFRPRIKDGMPVAIEDVRLEYLFPPQYNVLSVSTN